MKVKYFHFIEHMGNYMAEWEPTKQRSPRLIFWCFFCPGGSDHKGSTLLFLYKEKNILNHLTVNFLKFASLLPFLPAKQQVYGTMTLRIPSRIMSPGHLFSAPLVAEMQCAVLSIQTGCLQGPGVTSRPSSWAESSSPGQSGSKREARGHYTGYAGVMGMMGWQSGLRGLWAAVAGSSS